MVTYYLLFALELATRRVRFAGLTPNPDGLWMTQIARNLTDCQDGFLNGKRYLLLDRDAKFTEAFVHVLEQDGVQCLKLPPQSPNLNAHLERFMRSIKEECLSRMIFFGESSLRRAISTYLEHYHAERNHQGLDNGLIQPESDVPSNVGKIECRNRLGGMLRYYSSPSGLTDFPMIDWFKQRLAAWAGRVQQREIKRQTVEILETGSRSPPSQRRFGRFTFRPNNACGWINSANGIDPDVLRKIDLLADAK